MSWQGKLVRGIEQSVQRTFGLRIRILWGDDLRKVAQIDRIALNTVRRIDRAMDRPGGLRAAHVRNWNMAKTIDEALEAVRRASTRTDSIIADRASLKQQLADALGNVKLPQDVQDKIDAIFDIEETDAKKIDEALNTGVPPADVNPDAQAPAADKG